MDKDKILDMLEASFMDATLTLMKDTLKELAQIARTHGIGPEGLTEYVDLFAAGLVELCDSVVTATNDAKGSDTDDKPEALDGIDA